MAEKESVEKETVPLLSECDGEGSEPQCVVTQLCPH